MANAHDGPSEWLPHGKTIAWDKKIPYDSNGMEHVRVFSWSKNRKLVATKKAQQSPKGNERV